MRITGPIPQNILKRMPKEDRAPMGKAGVTNAEAEAKFDAKAEKEIQRQIDAWLRSQEFYFIRSRMDRKTSVQVGVPDFVVCAYGAFIAFEVKTSTGRLSYDQERAQGQILANMGKCYTVRSLSEVISVIKALNEPTIQPT